MAKPTEWPIGSKELSSELHLLLSLNDKNWHKCKNDSNRRAAELLSGAITQLINNGETYEIEQIISQSLLWLRKELKDPGCPDK